MKMICENCKFYCDLILWNRDGMDLPNYEEKSHCCTLFAAEGQVHQCNSGNSLCECFDLKRIKPKGITYKEARQILRGDFSNIDLGERTSIQLFDEAFKMAIKSIEFRIPEKVEDYHHCPNCGYGLPAKGITNDYCDCCFEWDFCPYCGQALDWSRKKVK